MLPAALLPPGDMNSGLTAKYSARAAGQDLQRNPDAWLQQLSGRAVSEMEGAARHILGHERDTVVNSRDPNVRIYQTAERQK